MYQQCISKAPAQTCRCLLADAAVDMSAFFRNGNEAVLPRHILAQGMVRSRLASAAGGMQRPLESEPACISSLIGFVCLRT